MIKPKFTWRDDLSVRELLTWYYDRANEISASIGPPQKHHVGFLAKCGDFWMYSRKLRKNVLGPSAKKRPVEEAIVQAIGSILQRGLNLDEAKFSWVTKEEFCSIAKAEFFPNSLFCFSPSYDWRAASRNNERVIIDSD